MSATVLVATVLSSLLSPVAARADSGVPAAFLRTLGGPGHAAMYPSGLEIGSDGSVVVADTGNSQVKKYAADGATLLWAIGSDGAGVGQFNDPRDIGIDSAGNIFVADTANARIVKLSSAGVWLTSFTGPVGDKIGSPIGLSVSADKLYVADAGKKKVRVFNTSGTQTSSFGQVAGCTFSPIRDVDADAAGNVYIANYTNNNILKMSATGTCLNQNWGTKGTANGQFKNPYGVRIGPDPWNAGQQLVYVADSNNNRNQVFTTGGVFVASLGTFGDETQPGTFSALRRVAVAPDGDIWGADLWGWRIERWNAGVTPNTWTYAQSNPTTPAPPPLTSTSVFNEVRSVAFDAAGRIYAMDTVNQRFVRWDPSTGSIINACGERGWSSGAFNWPRGIAIDSSTGQAWVTDTKQSRMQIINPDTCASIAKFGTVGSAQNQFNWPHAIAIRQSDRIAWVADTKNHRIVSYNVATRAVIATFGGLGSGVGQFNQPRGIAIDPTDGHILVADWKNNRIVELSDTGGSAITWVGTYTSAGVAGTFLNPQGVAADSDGRIYVADTEHSRVIVLEVDGSFFSEFTSPTGFSRPEAIAVNPVNNHVFVSDTYNDRIQEYDAFSGPGLPDPFAPPTYVRTLAGPGLADMYPVDVTDSASYYYVLDAGGYRVVAVNRTTGAIDFQVGGHQGDLDNQFGAARAIASDSAGNVYVADTANNRVKKFDPSLIPLTAWGTKGSANGQFNQVYGIAVGLGKGVGGTPNTEVVYTVDGPTGAFRVQKFDLNGVYIGQFGSVEFNEPRQIAVDPVTHNIWIVNSNSRQLLVFNEDGTFLFKFGGTGSGPGLFNEDPRGVTVTADGKVFASDPGNDRVQVFDTTGAFLYEVKPIGTQAFVAPRGLTVTPEGQLLVADQWDYALKEFDVAGTWIRELFGTPPPNGGVNAPRGMDVDPVSGRLFIDDWWNQRITRFESDGTAPFSFGFRGNRGVFGSLNFAWDVAVQPGTGREFVANRESNEVKVFDQDGTQITRWGASGTANGQMKLPQGLAFAPDGTLWLSDTTNHRIQHFSIDVNGNPTWLGTYGGPILDSAGMLCGGSSTVVGCFNTPTGIDVAADGTVFVADTNNNRIAKRNPTTGAWTVYTRPVGGSVFRIPWGVTVAPDGYIWVSDSGVDRIVKMDVNANQFFTFTGVDVGIPGNLDGPFDVAFGLTGQIYIADTWNNRIIELV